MTRLRAVTANGIREWRRSRNNYLTGWGCLEVARRQVYRGVEERRRYEGLTAVRYEKPILFRAPASPRQLCPSSTAIHCNYICEPGGESDPQAMVPNSPSSAPWVDSQRTEIPLCLSHNVHVRPSQQPNAVRTGCPVSLAFMCQCHRAAHSRGAYRLPPPF